MSSDPAIIIREARPDDAAAFIRYFRTILAEPGINLISEPDEFTQTIETEARYIRELARSENGLCLVAEANGMIVGQLTLQGPARRKVRHNTVLGITVAKEWRGQGIGRRLIERAITWSRETGVISRIELHVFAGNEGAIRLYKSLGFELEGTRRKALRKDGQYMDDLIMALLL